MESKWRDNDVSGYAAVLHLEVGIANLISVEMLGSNWDETLPPDDLSIGYQGTSYGGHLYL